MILLQFGAPVAIRDSERSEIVNNPCQRMRELLEREVPCQIGFMGPLSALLILLEIGPGRADKAEVSDSSPRNPTPTEPAGDCSSWRGRILPAGPSLGLPQPRRRRVRRRSPA